MVESKTASERLQEAEGDYKQHIQDMEAMTLEITNMRSSKEELHQEMDRLQEELKKANEEMQLEKKRCLDLDSSREEEILELNVLLEEARGETDQKEKLRKVLETELEFLKASSDENQTTVSATQSELCRSKEEVSSLEKANAQLMTEKNSVESRLLSVESDKNEWEVKHAEVSTKMLDLKSEIEELKAEHENTMLSQRQSKDETRSQLEMKSFESVAAFEARKAELLSAQDQVKALVGGKESLLTQLEELHLQESTAPVAEGNEEEATDIPNLTIRFNGTPLRRGENTADDSTLVSENSRLKADIKAQLAVEENLKAAHGKLAEEHAECQKLLTTA